MPEPVRPELRVLILTADVGEGHVAAGRALHESLGAIPGTSATVEDGLITLGRPARALIRDGYRSQLRSAPWTFTVMYLCWRWIAPLRWAGGWALYRVGRRRLRALVTARGADVVVSTHPALTVALGRMRRRGELDAVLCATITDLVENPMWCHRGTDLHVVMHPDCVAWVQRRAGRDSVVAVRPLVAGRFHAPRDVAGARTTLGLPLSDTLVVVSGGGWGVGALADGVAAALAAGADRVLALAGRNAEARTALDARFAADARVTVLGFTAQMPELLHAANVLVHGTGGVTTLEAIACGCPVVAFGTQLPHVREHNATLARLGLCAVARDRDELTATLATQLASPAPTGVVLTEAPASPARRLATLDAGRVIAEATRRVRPVSRWVRDGRRLSVALLCTGGALWTVATDDAFSLAARSLALHPATRLGARTRAIGLAVQAPDATIPGLARELAASGIHVSFAVSHALAPSLQRELRADGDDTVAMLPGSGAVRWLGTLDQLNDLRDPGSRRLLLAPPGRLSLGQYLFALGAGYRTLDPRRLVAGGDVRPRPAAGEIWLVSGAGPSPATVVRAAVARAAAASLTAEPLGRLLASAASSATRAFTASPRPRGAALA